MNGARSRGAALIGLVAESFADQDGVLFQFRP